MNRHRLEGIIYSLSMPKSFLGVILGLPDVDGKEATPRHESFSPLVAFIYTAKRVNKMLAAVDIIMDPPDHMKLRRSRFFTVWKTHPDRAFQLMRNSRST